MLGGSQPPVTPALEDLALLGFEGIYIHDNNPITHTQKKFKDEMILKKNFLKSPSVPQWKALEGTLNLGNSEGTVSGQAG